jgi:hypothetical protein
MPTTKNVMSGLKILLKYQGNPDSYHLGAEHDVLYFYPTDKQVCSQDIETLIALGWFQDDADTGDSDDFRSEHYDQDLSWVCFV